MDELTEITAQLEGAFDPETEEPNKESRLNIAAARGLFSKFMLEDSARARNRAKIDGMFDGLAPQSPDLLRSLGRGGEINVNMGTAQRALDHATAGFVDLVTSVPTLMNVETGIQEQGEKEYSDAVVAEHATHAIRNWPGFVSNFLRIVQQFRKHGVALALFPDQRGFRFDSAGLSDFFIPQQTPASQESIEVAFYRQNIPVEKLYAYISNQKAAEAMGWDYKRTRDAIMSATDSKNTYTENDWERREMEIKNLDYGGRSQYTNVPIVWQWVREFDGTLSFACFVESGTKNEGRKKGLTDGYIFKSEFLYDAPDKAFVTFTEGVGNNGTLHSIRGMGQRVFPIVQAYNRAYNAAMNGAMLSSGMMVKVKTSRDRSNLQFQQLGPLAVIPENVEIVERSIPNLSQSVMPMISDLDRQMSEGLDTYTSSAASGGNPYRNKLQVEAEIATATRLSTANLSLFYVSWDLLIREITRRIVKGPLSDPAIREFYRRCEADGVSKEVVKSIDFSRTSAIRAIGAGNSASRVVELDRIKEYVPQFDEVGRHNWLADSVAANIGHDAASRYVQPTITPRPTTDRKLADLENFHLLEGKPVEVQTNELHGEHLARHLPLMQELTVGIDEGQVDAMEVLQGITVLYEHSAEHTNFLATDPLSQPIVAEAKAILQRANEQILNYTRRAQAEAQDAAQEGEGNPEEDMKRMEQEQKMRHEQTMAQFKVKEAELRLAGIQATTAQKIALEDAKAQNSVIAGISKPGAR